MLTLNLNRTVVKNEEKALLYLGMQEIVPLILEEQVLETKVGRKT